MFFHALFKVLQRCPPLSYGAWHHLRPAIAGARYSDILVRLNYFQWLVRTAHRRPMNHCTQHLLRCRDSYVLTFVVVTILSAMDFWTVKNVSGRLLVGLRWWNDVDEAGENHWRFESFEVGLAWFSGCATPHGMPLRPQDQRFIHPTDSSFFWAVLFLTPLVWSVITLYEVITLKIMWALLTGACHADVVDLRRCP